MFVSGYLSGESAKKIAISYKVCSHTIRKILKKCNIKTRGYLGFITKDNSYFEKIDSQNKAYFLGLLYADGCNHEKGFDIFLQEPDKSILIKLKRDIGFSRKLHLRRRISKNRQHMYGMSICGVKFSKDLSLLGCFPRKSLTLKFPTSKQVPYYLIHHFLRGYFDGDGGVYLDKKTKYLSADICSSFEFCDSLKTLLKNDYNISSCIYKKSNNKIHVLIISGNKNIYKFFHLIYKDANIFLSRKFKRFVKGMESRKQRVIKFFNNKTSKFLGVTFHKSKKSMNWAAVIRLNGESRYLGYFNSEIEAAKAYNSVARKHNKQINNIIDRDANLLYYINKIKT
jgi:hypothetical protein